TPLISTLSLHDALPISAPSSIVRPQPTRIRSLVAPTPVRLQELAAAAFPGDLYRGPQRVTAALPMRSLQKSHITTDNHSAHTIRSEEHTSELQSREKLV